MPNILYRMAVTLAWGIGILLVVAGVVVAAWYWQTYVGRMELYRMCDRAFLWVLDKLLGKHEMK